jgi:Na+-driven multidrug efflux pump
MRFVQCPALDTLATQAYTSDQPKTTALYVQRTGVLIFMGCIPCCAVLFMADDMLLMIHQDPYVASLAGTYIRSASVYSASPVIIAHCLPSSLQYLSSTYRS